MFPKRHTPRKHFHVSHATHAHTRHVKHAIHNKQGHVSHTHHAFMYGRIYTCTYCSQNGHLAKFCYDRSNVSNDHVWVKRTNTIGPKKI